ncbi:methyltransferase domain-containing protein [Algoriphagus halophytocola]|uniref:class I SAM-dependent methyltransferase n=1 Tax=Algoriphagus halophytocola TaxID=2991499 RepID=UPI0022DE6272|nr:class I SAM-dependent methyltransferase [Algoriphagus sp. TR-M9]WBL42584.1 methyltransferase domain-containing protein [Algoriphagus sp. TR-M9]
MILYRACPICKSKNLRGFAIDTYRNGPHISRVKCADCELVFANPMADSQELAEYYTNYYQKEHYEAVDYNNLIVNHFKRIAGLGGAQVKQEARFLGSLKEGDRFLDVGCGLGLGLAYAHQLNCKLFATEFDSGALDFVKSHFPVKTFQGDIWDAKYPDSFFDFIHISHVIEHVLDPKGYIAEMKRILKPGGFLAIGTPNMSSNLYRFHRWSKLLRLQVPDVIDGLEHTFIFPKKLLREICEEQALTVELHYTHNFGEKLSNLMGYQMPLGKKLNRLIQNAFQVNQWVVCRK